LYKLDIKENEFNIGEIFIDDKEIKAVYWERVNLKEVILEVETKTAIEQGLVTGIITLLDTASIAS